jgi:hypothetical protein
MPFPSPVFDDGTEIVYVAYITLKNGKRIYAWQYGLKAFPLRVRKNRQR